MAPAPVSPAAAAHTTDAQLVRAALDDADAFRGLVERYQGRVFATCLRMLGRPADAQDAAQEAFLRAFRALDRFDASRPFGPWVCTIAANIARDQLRSPLRRFFPGGLFVSATATSAQVGDGVEQRQRRDLVADAVLRLAPKLRHAIVLRYTAGLSITELSRALNISESAAKMRLNRAHRKLKETLGDDVEVLFDA